MDRSFSFCAVPAAEGGWPLEILQNVEIQMDRRKRQEAQEWEVPKISRLQPHFPFHEASNIP